MANWSDLIKPKGTYTSKSYSISSNLGKYILDFSTAIQNINEQKIEFFFSVSYDNLFWTDWEKFNESSYGLLNNYNLKGLNFRYKVNLESENEFKKPYIQNLKLVFHPFSFVDNDGDLDIKPKLWITKKNGQGDIKLINHTTGQVLELRNLNNSEEVYIDCENEEIVSSNLSNGVYRYGDHNDEFLTLQRGENYLTSEGDFNLDIRFKAKLLQE